MEKEDDENLEQEYRATIAECHWKTFWLIELGPISFRDKITFKEKLIKPDNSIKIIPQTT